LFWILTVCLFLLAALFIVVPVLLRQRDDDSHAEELRSSANIALFHERSNELESDLATGDIDQQQFDRLMLELQQNLLADTEVDEALKSADEQSPKAKKKTKSGVGYSRTAILIPVTLALLLPVVAYVLYERWGYFDDIALQDLYERTMESSGNPQAAQELIIALGEAVQENEQQPWAWYFLGENLANLTMFNEAQIAYERSADLLPDGGEKALVLGRIALLMYVNADFTMGLDTEAVIAEARRLNPNEVSVLQLLAADAEQNEDWQSAIEYWRLLIQRDPNSAAAQELRINIAAAQQMLQGASEAAAGPVVEVAISLGEGIEIGDEIAANQLVFIAARNAEQEGLPPLAAVRLSVSELPGVVRLDNSSAVGPFNLSTASSIYVSALVSQTGVATPASGDYRVVSETIAIAEEAQRIELVLSERIP